MAERIISLTKNHDLCLEWHVSVESGVNEQIVAMFDAPRQVSQQSTMFFGKRISEAFQVSVLHTVRLKSGV